MKLKSKLIATIVSICAAIAVMGVGVWAATSSFTVSVTNNVNIEFTRLTGTVTVNATAKTGESVATLADKIDALEAELYTEATTDAQKTQTISAATGDANHHQWAGADLLTTANVDANTKYAQLQYVFTYTPSTQAGDAFTTVTISGINEISDGQGGTITYTYQIGSTNATEDTVYYAADNTALTVTITALYSNPNLVATKIGGATSNWEFTVSFANVLTAPAGGTQLS